MDPTNALLVIQAAGVFLAIVAGVKAYWDSRKVQENDRGIREARKRAYQESLAAPEIQEQRKEFARSQEGLEERVNELAKNLELEAKRRRRDLYTRQIEKYQNETQARASWSFMFAIFSMLAGFAFILGGGAVILADPGNRWNLVPGSFLAGIGGALSAYITKTFLGVHQLSLRQLNKYFEQPVVNDHILMAQQLADDLGGEGERAKAYERIIESISKLIYSESESDATKQNLG